MVYSPALDQIFNILPNLNDFLLWLEAKLISGKKASFQLLPHRRLTA